jgi:hypothetical protein
VIFGVEQKTKHEKKYFVVSQAKPANHKKKAFKSVNQEAQTSWAIIYVLIM